MDTISPEIAQELERRLAASSYNSIDALLRDALRALDDACANARTILERELLKGLEGDDVELTSEDWDTIEREALDVLKSKKSR